MDKYLREKLIGITVILVPTAITIGLLLLAHALGRIN